jgi:hypothetical protein
MTNTDLLIVARDVKITFDGQSNKIIDIELINM